MLALIGFASIAVFMLLVMTRSMSALVALIMIPILVGLLTGHGVDLGGMAMDGLVKLAPTASLLLFAVLYFGVMVDAGLFDPLVRAIVRLAGGDPQRLAIGTAVLAMIVSLDGDGATTALVTITAFLPIYLRLGMNPLIIAVLLGSSNSIVNLLPWGGPTGRVAAALHADPAQIFVPLLPTIAAGLAVTVAIGWWLGRGERRRLGIVAIDQDAPVVAFERPDGIARPNLLYLNLVLTLFVLVGAVLHMIPLPLLFMGALAIALQLNYPNLIVQRDRVMAHAANVLPIVILIIAAGIFTGVMGGTGLIEAMAKSIMAVFPPALGPWLAYLLAALSPIFAFVLPNDAYYFVLMPVIAQTGIHYGIDPAALARASLLGAPVHSLSPLVAAVYLVAGLLGRDIGDLQRFALPWALLLTLVMIATAALTGALI